MSYRDLIEGNNNNVKHRDSTLEVVSKTPDLTGAPSSYAEKKQHYETTEGYPNIVSFDTQLQQEVENTFNRRSSVHDEKITEVDEVESPQKYESSAVRDWINMQE